jgi:glycosyltransferase involved in cell wall biosynthesis
MPLAILIPAYNAARTLPNVLNRIRLQPEDFIVVVDDGSSDATAEIAAQDLRVHLVRHDRCQGYGSASTTLYEHALHLGATATVNVHSDGAHWPEEIPLVAGPVLRGEADVVLGCRILGIIAQSRRVLGSQTLGALLNGPMPPSRFFSNLALTAYQNLCYGTAYHSFHDGFRACSSLALKSVPYRSFGKWYQFDTEFLLAAHACGLRIHEVGVSTHYLKSPASATPRIEYGLRVVMHATRYRLKLIRRFPSNQ